MSEVRPPALAILIPCFNEAASVGSTVEQYREQFPAAAVYVCDNNSTDETAAIARQAGAVVLREIRKGKGWAVRRLFEHVQADFFILTDGDATYLARDADRLLGIARNSGVSMVVGDRLSKGAYENENGRPFHSLGNRLISALISVLFRTKISDALSGLRVFDRRFVNTVPLTSTGFEVEAELTAQAIDKGFPIQEVPISYRQRPGNNPSKLRTFSDGFRIISTAIRFVFYFRPMHICSSLSGACLIASIGLGIAPVLEYSAMQYVYRVPSLIVAVGFLILSTFLFFLGLVLEGMRFNQQENFLLFTRDFHKTHRAPKD